MGPGAGGESRRSARASPGPLECPEPTVPEALGPPQNPECIEAPEAPKPQARQIMKS